MARKPMPLKALQYIGKCGEMPVLLEEVVKQESYTKLFEGFGKLFLEKVSQGLIFKC